jgi:uridine kinase
MGDKKHDVRFTNLNEEIQVHLPDNRVISGSRGIPVERFLNLIEGEDAPQIVGAVVNGALRELTYQIDIESKIAPVTMGTADGMRIYRRSLTLLLGAACEKLFPGVDLVVDHSVSFGGYFCRVLNRDALSEEELFCLKERMTELVEQDLVIERREVSINRAIKHFESTGQEDKVKLLRHRKKDYLMLYYLGDHCDYHHGYMVPSTGYLKWFDLQPAKGGFTLRFPRRHNPTEILPLHQYPKLLATFRQYGDWLELLGIGSVGALNDAILDGRIREVILVSEALHNLRIAEIATQISSRRDEIRVVVIAGPSSSSKTTSSRRLMIQLLAHGLQPFALEMDNYFVERSRTPKDENGEYDYEHIDAVDHRLLNKNIISLIDGAEVQLPHYDFRTGKSHAGERIQLRPNQIVILEGIHGLSPELLAKVPEEQIFRIYISALTQLNLDRYNRVSTTDTRLIRRIVRDARTRGYSPQETIQRWESVRRGEKRYIFPFQENADMMFNSALAYELAALKPLAEPLLRQVPFGTSEHIESKRLLSLLEWFLPLDTSLIPDDSLMREFIGGSILKDFKLWGYN